MIRVGHVRWNYGHERVLYGARNPSLVFRRVPSLPLHRVTKDPFWAHATAVLSPAGADIVHLYNNVAFVSPRPWVASFEDAYPVGARHPRLWARARHAAASSRCRALLPISEHARRRLAAEPAARSLLAKCRVVQPCVPREDDLHRRHLAWLERNPPGAVPLRLLFVGNQFSRKGGEFVLDALEPLVARGDPPTRLTIVSTLEKDTYVSRVDAARLDAVRARIAGSPWIEHVEGVSAREVRERMADSHLLLFPTLNDSFGFVLAEALATGLDAVTVASRAIPEILPPERVPDAIRVALNGREEWAGTRLWRTAGEEAWRREWEDARERIVEGIRARVAAVLSDPGLLARRAPAARAWYEERFSPEALGRRLLAVYREALPALGR